MKIGQTELKNNLILAPMAGVSDLPFRMLCAEQGAGLVCMEMVSAKAILFHNRNTEELMRRIENEEVYMGGCLIMEGYPQYHCYACGQNVGKRPAFYARRGTKRVIEDYRRIAALVCYQVLDYETNKAIRTNQAIQDFYAMECWRQHPDWQSLDDCEEFIRTALDGMQQIEKHYDEGHAAGLNDEEIRVLDALYGFAPHDYFKEDFPRVRDLCKAAKDMLPDKPYVKSENGQREYAHKMHEAFKEIFAKYDTHYDPSDLTDLTPGYLDSWIYDKYYE